MILSQKILTIGPVINPPKGGVAQCISTYKKTIYTDFKFIANSCDGSKLKKIWKFCCSLLHLFIKLLVDNEIKIVHIHTASNNSFRRSAWYVKVAKIQNRKVVLHIHGGGFKTYYTKDKAFIDSILHKCDALVTLSNSWKKFIEDATQHPNVFVVPNIIEQPIDIEIQKDDKFHLLFLGHIYKEKGIFDLVEVIKEFQNEYRDKLILDIGGGLYDVEILKQFINDNSLDDIIHFHGWVSGKKKNELLCSSDAYILPSYAEGVPISILESESHGLPILATPVGGIPDVVVDGVNGILFPPGDKTKMKQAIDQICQNTEMRYSMGQASQQISMEHLPSSVELNLQTVYQNL